MTNTQASPIRKHAVILSGGGANGAYEIGVMKALFGGYVDLRMDSKDAVKRDPFRVFTGTSVGSFNAAFMVSRPGQSSTQTVDELEQLWRQRIAGTKTRANGVFRIRGNPLDFVDLNRILVNPLAAPTNLFKDSTFFARDFINRTEQFFRSKEEVSKRFMGLLDFGALVSTEPLHDLVLEEIDLGDVRANEERTLVVAATNWEEGTTELFTNKEGHDKGSSKLLDDKIGHLAILASTAIPGIFPPVEIYHTRYVDGGLLMNTPLSPAIRAGADVIHVIYLDPDLKDVPLERSISTLDILNRMVALAFASQVNRDIKRAKHLNQLMDFCTEMEGALTELELGKKERDDLKGIVEEHKKTYPDGVRAVTIHRYHPNSMLEGGVFGLLDFDIQRVSELIDIGFKDAVTHDCSKCSCIFPTLKDLRSAEKAVAAAYSLGLVGAPPAMTAFGPLPKVVAPTGGQDHN